ncbi:MAG: hypothetical protein ACTSXA_15225 [Candidatus Heimdallarchaeota archaeon]
MEQLIQEKEKKIERPLNLTALVLFVVLILSVLLYLTTGLRYYSDLVLLPPRYSVAAVLGVLPILFSLTNFLIFTWTLNGIKKTLKQSDLGVLQQFSSQELVDELKSSSILKFKILKTILWLLFFLTILTLVLSQVYLIVSIFAIK